MEQKERDALKERIASLINHGLDNREIAEELKNEVGLAAKLIALIRDYQMDTENLVNSKECLLSLLKKEELKNEVGLTAKLIALIRDYHGKSG